jgi:hypothetical protein
MGPTHDVARIRLDRRHPNRSLVIAEDDQVIRLAGAVESDHPPGVCRYGCGDPDRLAGPFCGLIVAKLVYRSDHIP